MTLSCYSSLASCTRFLIASARSIAWLRVGFFAHRLRAEFFSEPPTSSIKIKISRKERQFMANGPMEFDLVITNGKLAIPPDIISSSLGIKGEKIVAIATDLGGFPAKKTIDAKGNYVLPGVVDPETHLG